MGIEERKIKQRVLTFAFVLSGTLPLAAQTQEKDKGIHLNEDAVRMIQFDFSGVERPEEEPMESPIDKPWMSFKHDLRMPRSLTDTTKVKKPTGYIRAEPYTIWTRFGEDPVYDVMVLGRPKKWEIHWSLNPYTSHKKEYEEDLTPGTITMNERATERIGGSLGAGITICDLDFLGFIYNNLTPYGRMLKHNRKHANAWKIYKDYRPTREDSLKFPTYYRLLPIYASADTDTLARPVQADTLLRPVPQDTLPKQQEKVRPTEPESQPQPDSDRFYEYIRQRQAEDSIRRREFFRKDKVRNNAYEIEQQIRRIKENQN